MRKKTLRVLWLVILLLIATFQAMMFLRLRRQSVPIFHSTLEMVLVVALIAVLLLGVVVKSRQAPKVDSENKRTDGTFHD